MKRSAHIRWRDEQSTWRLPMFWSLNIFVWKVDHLMKIFSQRDQTGQTVIRGCWRYSRVLVSLRNEMSMFRYRELSLPDLNHNLSCNHFSAKASMIDKWDGVRFIDWKLFVLSPIRQFDIILRRRKRSQHSWKFSISVPLEYFASLDSLLRNKSILVNQQRNSPSRSSREHDRIASQPLQ